MRREYYTHAKFPLGSHDLTCFFVQRRLKQTPSVQPLIGEYGPKRKEEIRREWADVKDTLVNCLSR